MRSRGETLEIVLSHPGGRARTTTETAKADHKKSDKTEAHDKNDKSDKKSDPKKHDAKSDKKDKGGIERASLKSSGRKRSR